MANTERSERFSRTDGTDPANGGLPRYPSAAVAERDHETAQHQTLESAPGLQDPPPTGPPASEPIPHPLEAASRPRATATVRRRARPSAGDFTSDQMLRPRAEPPHSGWRRFLYTATAGAVNLGPGPAELRERELIGSVRAPIAGCRRIAVVSRKGGVGKTTTTLNLGHTFATHRGDRVVALDGNPDAGSLGYRVRRETSNTITNLLVSRNEVSRYADIRAFTSQAPTRLEVIAADDDPRITDALQEDDYRLVVDLLEVHYNLICMDTGTGVLESASKGILQLADHLVLVTSPSLDSGRAASSTLDWLEKNGHEDLVAGAVAVINGVRSKGMVDLDRVERHFQARCRAVVRIPWDETLEAGAESSLGDMRSSTRDSYLELAAQVARGFAEPSLRA
jgi:putative peptide zinc metalloprotease protein